MAYGEFAQARGTHTAILRNLSVWNSNEIVTLRVAAERDLDIDCSGLTVAPGLRDPHVHFRDPGQTKKEDMVSGAQSAAAGGYTGVLIMPNTIPALDGVPIEEGVNGYSSSLDYLDKYEDANHVTLPVRYALCASSSIGREGRAASKYEDWEHALPSGKSQFAHPVIASSDDGSAVTDGILDDVAAAASHAHIPFIDHCEHHDSGVMNDGEVSARLGLPGIPASTELTIINRDIDLARRTGLHVHLQHVSTAESFEAIRSAKAEGINITCETAPHYITLNDSAVERYGTYAKMNPPLHSEADRQATVQAVVDGTVDMIATDHAPHTVEEKAAGMMSAPNGIIGLETAYPVLYTALVKTGLITAQRLIELMSVKPAELLGSAVFDISQAARTKTDADGIIDLTSADSEIHSDDGKPSETTGPFSRFVLDFEDSSVTSQAADLVILDNSTEWTIDSTEFVSKARNTPFNRWAVTGQAKATIIGGALVYNALM